MKTVKKNVYYCDHCNKKGLVAMHIRNHEGRCTNNPNRYCGACELPGLPAVIVPKLMARFTLSDNLEYDPTDPVYNPGANMDEKLVTWINEPITLQEIRNMVDNCPACILAILRQSGLNRHYFHLEAFDFKMELKRFISEKNYDGTPFC